MASISGQTRAATALYIADMVRELRTMGQQLDADFLVYLLEMAAMEASDIAEGSGTPGRKVVKAQEKPRRQSAEELAELYFSGAYD